MSADIFVCPVCECVIESEDFWPTCPECVPGGRHESPASDVLPDGTYVGEVGA